RFVLNPAFTFVNADLDGGVAPGAFLLLGLDRRGKKAHVLRGAREREEEREIDEHPAHADHVDDAEVQAEVREAVRVAEDEGDDADHLEGGLHLPFLAGADDHPLARGDAAEAGDRDLARQEENHDPRRDAPHRHHPDERRHDDELVGERVEELPEDADDVELPRQVAVEHVGDGGGGEDDAGPVAAHRRRRVEQPDEERDRDDAPDRQEVRQVDGVFAERTRCARLAGGRFSGHARTRGLATACGGGEAPRYVSRTQTRTVPSPENPTSPRCPPGDSVDGRARVTRRPNQPTIHSRRTRSGRAGTLGTLASFPPRSRAKAPVPRSWTTASPSGPPRELGADEGGASALGSTATRPFS